jgi:hypothetical protein
MQAAFIYHTGFWSTMQYIATWQVMFPILDYIGHADQHQAAKPAEQQAAEAADKVREMCLSDDVIKELFCRANPGTEGCEEK